LEFPISATKHYVPTSHTDLVERLQLFQLLESGSKGKLTLISAPAGFGKTTLLSKWLGDTERAAAWISLDKNDNNVTGFFTNFIFGIKRISPDFGDQLLMMLQAPQPPENEIFLSMLLNEIMDTMEPFTLVLDDYHFIELENIHQALAYLLANLPSNMRVIISCRADPPLPLGRLRANGELAEIRADDLRFSVEETSLFFKQTMLLQLSGEAIALLEERTEGWIAGLHLAGLSMAGKDSPDEFVQEFSGSHQYVIDYLVEEVLNQQTAEYTDFLLSTSILDQFNASLCNTLTQNTDSQTILNQLVEKNLFIISLDNQQQWYRYHHLFADLLRKRINNLAPDKSDELNRKASRWYEKQGMIDDAIQHALNAKDYQKAAELVEIYSKDWVKHSQFEKLTHWLSAFPDEIRQARPHLEMVYGWSNALFNKFDIAAPAFQIAEDGFHKASSSPARLQELNLDTEKKQALLLGQIATGRASIARATGDLAGSIELLHTALDIFPESEENERSVAYLFLGYAFWMSGKITKALDMFDKANSEGLAGDNLLTVQSAIDASGKLLFENGSLHQGMKLHQQAIAIAKRYAETSGIESSNVGLAHNGMAKIYYEWNDLDQALMHATYGVQVFETWGVTENLLDSYSILWRIKYAQGDAPNALLIAEKAATLVNQPGVADWLQARAITDQASLWIYLSKAQAEHIPAASRWVKTANLSYEDEFTYFQEADYIALARFFLYQDRTREMLVIVARLLKGLEDSDRTGKIIEVLILRALAAQKENNLDQAIEVLLSAVTLAKQENMIRTFINEGEALQTLLELALKAMSDSDFVTKLLNIFKATNQQQGSLIENLSARELEVLHLMAEGFTAPEIGDRLILSLNTIKTHIKNIYSKLGVNKRSSALIAGRELNLIK